MEGKWMEDVIMLQCVMHSFLWFCPTRTIYFFCFRAMSFCWSLTHLSYTMLCMFCFFVLFGLFLPFITIVFVCVFLFCGRPNQRDWPCFAFCVGVLCSCFLCTPLTLLVFPFVASVLVKVFLVPPILLTAAGFVADQYKWDKQQQTTCNIILCACSKVNHACDTYPHHTTIL